MLRMYLSAYLRAEVLNSVESARSFGLQYFFSDISLDENIVMLPIMITVKICVAKWFIQNDTERNQLICPDSS